MSSLTRTGTVAYGRDAAGGGGYSFPVESRTKISVNRVQGVDARKTKWVEYTFDVSSYILLSGIQTDSSATIGGIRKALEQQGQRFEYINNGFTDVNVSPSGPFYDVNYGPRSSLKLLVPMGPANSWQVSWSCTIALPDQCNVNLGFSGGIVDYDYEIDFSLDDKGYLTRTISGSLEIAAYKTVVGFSSDVADMGKKGDDYWAFIYGRFLLPPRCKRRTSRRLSNDRKKVNFSIIDTEYTNKAFMDGMVDWNGTVEVNCDQTWRGKATVTYSADYEVSESDDPQNLSKQVALERYSAWVTAGLRNNPWWKNPQGAGGVNVIRGENRLIPISFRASIPQNTNRISLSTTYWFFGKPEEFLLAAGAWIPVPNQGWDAWSKAKNIQGTALAPRGNMGLFYNGSNDAIIDICSAPKAAAAPVPVLAAPVIKLKPIFPVAGADEERFIIPIENSWVDYMAWTETWVSSNAVFHDPLGNPNGAAITFAPTQGAATGPGGAKITPPFQDYTGNAGYQVPPIQGAVPAAIVQYPKAGTVFIRLSGWAIRAGHRITPPALIKFGGVTPTFLNTYVKESYIGLFGVPVYFCLWAVDYRLPSAPQNTVLPIAPPDPRLATNPSVGQIK